MASNHQRHERLYKRAAIMLLAIIVIASIVGVLVPAGIGWDFANFYDTGRRAAAWQIEDLYSPESRIAGESPQGGMAFWGAPVSALLYAPLSLFSPNMALIAFKIENMLACFAGLWLLYRHNLRFIGRDRESQWRYAAIFCALILVFQPFWSIYRVGGQTTPTVFLLLVIALISLTENRLWIAAVCLILAVLIKPGFVFILVPLTLLSGWRFVRNLAVTSAGIGIFSIILMGWGVHEQFLKMMIRGSQGGYPWFYNSSLYVAAENLKLLASPPVVSPFLGLTVTAVKAIVLGLTFYLLWVGRKKIEQPEAARHFNFQIACVFTLLISQTVWEHYLAVMFIPLSYIVASCRSTSRGASILLGLIFLFSAGQNIILINVLRYRFDFNTVPELILAGLLKSAPLVLMLIFLAFYNRQMLRSYQTPAWAGTASN